MTSVEGFRCLSTAEIRAPRAFFSSKESATVRNYVLAYTCGLERESDSSLIRMTFLSLL